MIMNKLYLKQDFNLINSAVYPLEIYDQQGRVQFINSYRQNPYQTTGWRLFSIINRIIAFIAGGPLSTQVRVEVQPGRTEYLFVNVKDLSKCFGKSIREFHRLIKGQEISNFLAVHNTEKVIDDIAVEVISTLGLSLKNFDSDARNHLKTLAACVGYRNIQKALGQKQEVFGYNKLIALMVQSGKALPERTTQIRHIGSSHFKIDYHPDRQISSIVIATKTSENGIDYLVELNLNTLEFEKKKISKFEEIPSSNQSDFKKMVSFEDSSQNASPSPGLTKRLASSFGRLLSPNKQLTFIKALKKSSKVKLNSAEIQSLKEMLTLISEQSFSHLSSILRSNETNDLAMGLVKMAKEHSQGNKVLQQLLRQEFLTELASHLISKNKAALALGFNYFITHLFEDSLETGVLVHLLDKVPAIQLVVLLARMNEERMKAKLWSTFLQVARELNYKRIDAFYQGKEKIEDKNSYFAFAIKQENIVIAFGKQYEIGKGRSKIVTEGFYLNKGINLVRIKLIKPDFQELIRFERETRIRDELFKCLTEEEKAYFASPYLIEAKKYSRSYGGDIPIKFQFQYEKETKTILWNASSSQQLSAISDAAYGLAVMHKNGFAHIDLKPDNLLIVQENGQLRVKITDFGGTVQLKTETQKGNMIREGSPFYLPHETSEQTNDADNPYKLKECMSSDSIDSFTLGVSILEILNKEELEEKFKAVRRLGDIQDQKFLDQHTREIFNQANQKFPFTSRDKTIREELFNICQQLLKVKPEERLSCTIAADKLKQLCQTWIR